ncbi:hypothetical protein BDC45DRAFT_533870 [Circinella umbellata]|nr:hypothetical protein BDC45DRAFT_533870 [Circinella umbellata]
MNNNNNNNPLSGIRDVNVMIRLLKKRPVEDSLSSPPPTHHSPLPRNHPHQDHTSPRQQPSSSSHQPLEGMLDPRMPSLHTAFLNNNDNDNDNSTSRFWQNTFADRGVFIPTTRRNSALSSSTPSTTEQRAGHKKKGKHLSNIHTLILIFIGSAWYTNFEYKLSIKGNICTEKEIYFPMSQMSQMSQRFPMINAFVKYCNSICEKLQLLL